jgi:tetratricopeptide (TPR) repeat protein
MNSILTAIVMAITVAFTQPVLAQDDVVQRWNGITDRGTIISQDAGGIRMLRADTRREILISADQIKDVQVKLTVAHERADKLFEERDYVAAAERFEEALKVETRRWLRSKIAARLVACHIASGDSIAAISAFFSASQAADGQISVSAVPLWWLPQAPSTPVTQHASAMLQSNNPLEQVIGASFLFGTDHSEAARGIVSQLTTYRDERVSQMARTQSWRWEVATATASDVAAWQRQVMRLPAEARGGPYFVIGLALARLGKNQDAALAFLWPALVYLQDPKLSRQAALLAADCLERDGQRAEAVQLYAEVIGRFASTPEAATAQKRLDALKE